jgi:hypothetical protein
MKRFLVFVALLCLLGIWLSNCATGSKKESFEHWTRYYEIRMDLPPAEIRFVSPPNARCAQTVWEQWIGRTGPENVLVIYYNPDKKLCRSPWDLALHEACHRRLQHHILKEADVEAMGIDPEREADSCEGWYR